MSLTTIKFAKTRPDAIVPKKRDEDAGYDIYACFDDEYLIIEPNETVLIPTGICSAFDIDYVCVLKERGSTGTKGMGQRCGIIDSGFRGVWQVPITNHNDIPILIGKKPIDDYIKFGAMIYYPYTKAIAQFLVLPVPEVEIEEYTEEEILKIPSQRGEGMLGSSGK